MRMKYAYLLAALSCVAAFPIHADINFGSRESGLMVSAGTLALGSVTLSDGSLRKTGGTLTGTVTATGMGLETKSGTSVKRMTSDGTVVIGTSLTLGNNQKLTVNGGTVAEAVTVDGVVATPSIIEGFGEFASAITVSDQAQLNLSWNGVLNKAISLNSAVTSGHTAVLQLHQDLHMQGAFVTASDTGTNTVDFNGYRLSVGGSNGASVTIANSQSWDKAALELTSPLAIAASKTITFASAGYINGNNNALAFNSSSVLANGGYVVSMSDIALTGLTSASLSGSGSWSLSGVTLADSNNTLLVDGSITSSTVDVFGGAATFGVSRIALLKDFAPGGTITIGGATTINGRGNTLDLNGGGAGKKLLLSAPLRLENIKVVEAVAASIDTATGSTQTVYLSDVTWAGALGSTIHVDGTTQANSQGCATLTLSSSTTAGNIFGSAVTWTTGANIELKSDVTLDSTWTFADNSVIEGNGHTLTIGSGVLKIADNKTVKLRNVVLKGVVSASLTASGVTNFGGTLDLSNVTILVGGSNVTWSGTVTVSGPLTVVTGSHTFTGSAMTVNGVTAYYDTLGASLADNFVASSLTNSARILAINAQYLNGELGIAADTNLDHNEHLFVTVGGIAGRTISCTDNATLDGAGRTISFGGYGTVLSVAATKTLKTTNVVLEGLVPATHINLNTTGALVFGDKTTIRLASDITLASGGGFLFGTSTSVEGEDFVLDLNGHSLDLTSAGITLRGNSGDGTSNILTIKNGRLLNVNALKLSATAYNRIILEDVELALSADTTWQAGALSIAGVCALSGLAGSIFSNESTDEFLIQSNSRLTVRDGIIYSHNNAGATNFAMTDRSSQLELLGGTFEHPDTATQELTLSVGTIIIDHKSYIKPGNDNMTLSSNLAIEVRPGATIQVGTSSAASAGTLSYA